MVFNVITCFKRNFPLVRMVLATRLCLTAKGGHLQKILAMKPFGPRLLLLRRLVTQTGCYPGC